jgi:hypothetical protein
VTDAGSSAQPDGKRIIEHELEQCQRVNQVGRQPVVFVHGLWLLLCSAGLLGEAGRGHWLVESDRLTADLSVLPSAGGRQLRSSASGGFTGGNRRNDVSQPIPLVGAVPPILGRRDRPRRRRRVLLGDRGHDHDEYGICCLGCGATRALHGVDCPPRRPCPRLGVRSISHDCPQPDRP